jgi:hypothetical protein
MHVTYFVCLLPNTVLSRVDASLNLVRYNFRIVFEAFFLVFLIVSFDGGGDFGAS